MSELFCTTCEKWFSLDDLVKVTDWRGRRGKGDVAVFLDKAGLAHTLMSKKASAKIKAKLPLPQPKPEPQVTVVKKEVLPTVEIRSWFSRS